MENLLIWGFILAIALFALPVGLLISAERELKTKSRRLAEIEYELGNLSETKTSGDQEETQLPEMERRVVELREENSRLQVEIAELKKEPQASQEKAQQLEDTQEKHAEMERQGSELEEGNSRPQTEITQLKTEQEVSQEAPGLTEREISELQDQVTSSLTSQTLPMVLATEPEHAAGDEVTGRRRKIVYAVSFGTILVFALAGILAAGLWRDHAKEEGTGGADQFMITPQTDHPTEGESGTHSPETAAQVIEVEEDEYQAPPSTKQVEEPQKPVMPIVKKSVKPVTAPAPKSRAISSVTSRPQSRSPKKTKDVAKATQLSWGQYEILNPTTVYSKPREQSPTVASISAGVKVNVVELHGDWLEIRSKYGRPPGFIKKDSARPTGIR